MGSEVSTQMELKCPVIKRTAQIKPSFPKRATAAKSPRSFLLYKAYTSTNPTSPSMNFKYIQHMGGNH